MKTIVITGAASGLGKALALLYAKQDYQIVIADIDDKNGLAIVQLINDNSGKAHYCHCDVSNASEFNFLADFVAAECGGCNILINNAGIASSGTLLETEEDEWERIIQLNLMSCIYGSKAFIPLIKQTVTERNPGAIVNIGSLAAVGLLGGMISYNVSKAAVVAFSESLRCELLQDNIHVTVACPSFFKTNLTKSMVNSSAETISKVERWMEHSSLTADSVAKDIMQGIIKKELVIFSDKKVNRIYRIYRFIYKRLVPNKRSKTKV